MPARGVGDRDHGRGVQEVVRRQVLGPQLQARIDVAALDLEQLDPEPAGQPPLHRLRAAVRAAPTRAQAYRVVAGAHLQATY